MESQCGGYYVKKSKNFNVNQYLMHRNILLAISCISHSGCYVKKSKIRKTKKTFREKENEEIYKIYLDF